MVRAHQASLTVRWKHLTFFCRCYRYKMPMLCPSVGKISVLPCFDNPFRVACIGRLITPDDGLNFPPTESLSIGIL